MTRLPVVSARDAIKAFGQVGYEVDHQTGSHVVLRQNSAPHRRLVVPNHQEIAKGTLRAPSARRGYQWMSSQACSSGAEWNVLLRNEETDR